MGSHSVVRGEKSSFGQSNGAPREGNYQGRHRKEETTPLDDRGKATDSRLSGGGWLKKKK